MVQESSSISKNFVLLSKAEEMEPVAMCELQVALWLDLWVSTLNAYASPSCLEDMVKVVP